MKNTKEKSVDMKKTWETPSVTHHGSVEKITLGPKGWGSNDGMGMEPGVHHPSL